MAIKTLKFLRDDPSEAYPHNSGWCVFTFDHLSVLPKDFMGKLKEGKAFFLEKSGDNLVVKDVKEHASPVGIVVWTDHDTLQPAYSDRKFSAECFVELYNDWRNGRVWGYIVEWSVGAAGGWGFYESDRKTLADEVRTAFQAGDRVKVEGNGKHLFRRDMLPEGVEVVDGN